MTQTLLTSLAREFDFIHLETADRRGVDNIGRFELGNALLALTHGFQFLWLVATRQPDLVYVPISQGTAGFLRDCLFLLPTRLLGTKTIVHLHGSYFGRFYASAARPLRALIRLALSQVRRAIVLGETARPCFDGICPAERVVVVPNGIDGTEVLRAAHSSVPGPSKGTLLFLSNLTPGKGYWDLLHALPSIRRQIGSVRCIFAGEFPTAKDEQLAQEYVDSAKLGLAVEFVGRVAGPAKVRVLNEADIFVFPSCNPISEGQPVVILEAMAAGLPVVATDHGATRETVVDGVTGFLIPTGAPEEIARRVVELLENPELRCKMGDAGRSRFRQCYTDEVFAANLARVFRSALK